MDDGGVYGRSKPDPDFVAAWEGVRKWMGERAFNQMIYAGLLKGCQYPVTKNENGDFVVVLPTGKEAK